MHDPHKDTIIYIIFFSLYSFCFFYFSVFFSFDTIVFGSSFGLPETLKNQLAIKWLNALRFVKTLASTKFEEGRHTKKSSIQYSIPFNCFDLSVFRSIVFADPQIPFPLDSTIFHIFIYLIFVVLFIFFFYSKLFIVSFLLRNEAEGEWKVEVFEPPVHDWGWLEAVNSFKKLIEVVAHWFFSLSWNWFLPKSKDNYMVRGRCMDYFCFLFFNHWIMTLHRIKSTKIIYLLLKLMAL